MDQKEEEIREEEVPVQNVISSLMAGISICGIGSMFIGSKPSIYQMFGVVAAAIVAAVAVYIWKEGKSGT